MYSSSKPASSIRDETICSLYSHKISSKRLHISVELSLEELEDVNKVYTSEVSKLAQEVQVLEEENKRLKRMLGK